jgi:hypothetical protein
LQGAGIPERRAAELLRTVIAYALRRAVSEVASCNAARETEERGRQRPSTHAELAGGGGVKAIRLHGPVAAGTTFEGDIATGVVGSFVSSNRIEQFATE